MDICRQSIIFDDIDGISSCLKAIHYDADISILQVRFHAVSPMWLAY